MPKIPIWKFFMLYAYKRKCIFTIKSIQKTDLWNKEKREKKLINSKKLPSLFWSGQKYRRKQCFDFCSGRRKRKVAWDDAREDTKQKKKCKGGSEWERWSARTIGIVKNNSDRRSCGSCKHEPEHGKTSMRSYSHANRWSRRILAKQ